MMITEENNNMNEYISIFESLFWQKKVTELHKVFSTIFDHAFNGILIVLNDGTIIYINPAYTNITGTLPELRMGKNILTLDPTCPISKTLITGKAIKNECFKVCDAKNKLVANTTPIYDSTGKIIGAISIFHELQEILHLQTELQKKEKAIQLLTGKLSAVSSAKYNFCDIIGNSSIIKQTITMAAKVADTDITVLISGESGVGKEMFAHAIHANSKRCNAPFVRINCAAIPENLIESELFGYEKGAFTGAAQQKIGMFELANNGTILLDEIGEMSLPVQSRLLRVLEEREFYRIGGQKPIRLDIRVLAATNRNLLEHVAEGEFREDLYYRINIFNIEIPPLRVRGEDILMLAQHFLDSFSKHMGKQITGISESGKMNLLKYSWPGNIRELRNVIERAVVLCNGSLLMDENLNIFQSIPSEKKKSGSRLKSLDELEQQVIKEGIDLYGSSVEGKVQIAKLLGISTRTLYSRLKKYNII